MSEAEKKRLRAVKKNIDALERKLFGGNHYE